MEQSFVLQLNTLSYLGIKLVIWYDLIPTQVSDILANIFVILSYYLSIYLSFYLSFFLPLSIFFSPSILSINLIYLSIYLSYSSIHLCERELLTVIQQGRMSLISLMLSLMTVRACSASSLIMASPSTSLRNRGGKPKLTSFNFYSPLDVKHLYNQPLPFPRTSLPEFQKLKAFRGGNL